MFSFLGSASFSPCVGLGPHVQRDSGTQWWAIQIQIVGLWMREKRTTAGLAVLNNSLLGFYLWTIIMKRSEDEGSVGARLNVSLQGKAWMGSQVGWTSSCELPCQILLQEKGMEKGDWGREKRMMKLVKRFWKIK